MTTLLEAAQDTGRLLAMTASDVLGMPFGSFVHPVEAWGIQIELTRPTGAHDTLKISRVVSVNDVMIDVRHSYVDRFTEEWFSLLNGLLADHEHRAFVYERIYNVVKRTQEATP